MDINFEDYDIECNKDKTNNIAIKKNIGIIIENDIINFIKEIKENYSISLITNNDTDKIIFSQNINNFIKINKITKLDNEIYDLVK
jgi:hypothetical protein